MRDELESVGSAVRRNVVVEDAVLDSNYSLVINQANNRTYAAQTILKKIILNEG